MHLKYIFHFIVLWNDLPLYCTSYSLPLYVLAITSASVFAIDLTWNWIWNTSSIFCIIKTSFIVLYFKCIFYCIVLYSSAISLYCIVMYLPLIVLYWKYISQCIINKSYIVPCTKVSSYLMIHWFKNTCTKLIKPLLACAYENILTFV